MDKKKISIYDKIIFGNFGSKKIPNTDNEMSLDKKTSKLIIDLYDRVFGTSIGKEVGNDYSLILSDPAIHYICSGDILRVLIFKTKNADDTYINKMDIGFDNNLSGKIYETIMTSKESVLYDYFISLGMKKFYYKKEILSKFFYYLGEYLNQEKVKSLLDIKNKNVKYETKSEKYIPIDDKILGIFIVAFRKSMERFNDVIDLKVFCEFMERYIRQTPKTTILYKLLRNSLNKFLNKLYKSL